MMFGPDIRTMAASNIADKFVFVLQGLAAIKQLRAACGGVVHDIQTFGFLQTGQGGRRSHRMP